tara:strand:- start:409 stop:597 length:189 start_codon:yes stop_codon:yes gene_type:complete
MNDLETMKEMLTRSNIEYDIYYAHGMEDDPRAHLTVNGGYHGFYTIFKFEEDGSLASVEAYE